jgi:hydroxyacyl-ACP dehydratase HTD2-like protein with hotdog domain
MGMRIREGYEGIVVAGAMLVVAMVVVAARLLFG